MGFPCLELVKLFNGIWWCF